MSERRIYRPGARIRRLSDLIGIIERNGTAYVNHKPYHAGWLVSMQLISLKRHISNGEVRRAVLTPYGRKVMADRAAEHLTEEALCD